MGIAVLGACARAPGPALEPALRQATLTDSIAEPDLRIFLIGDAGGSERNPVLTSLGLDLRRDGARSLVLFLGDNVYPSGLPDSASSRFPAAERRLRAQMDVVRSAGARAVFLPGNHDWGRRGKTAGRALLREAAYVTRVGGPSIVVLPEPACPGPSVLDLMPSVRVVLLDTEWWLRTPAQRGTFTPSSCKVSENEVLASLRSALSSAGARRVIVAGHHPLVSGGPHGSRLGWSDQLFPLRDAWEPLWVPLPVVGSVYQLGRWAGRSAQDLGSPPYRRMRLALEGVFAAAPPLVYASGHEHNLQVLRGPAGGYRLVSGAGTYDHASRVSYEESTTFARSASGYMRLDVWDDGPVRLNVVLVGGAGAIGEPISMILDAGATALAQP